MIPIQFILIFTSFISHNIIWYTAALVSEELAQKTQRRLEKYRAKFEVAKRYEKQMVLQQQQRQQRLWLAGGTTLVVAILSLIWYKRSVAQKRSKRRRDFDKGGSRDLFLDQDGDEFDGTEEELQQVFDEASQVARAFPKGMLNQKDQLMIYGLYKQANEGDRSDDNAVSFFCYIIHSCAIMGQILTLSAMKLCVFTAIKDECCCICKI